MNKSIKRGVGIVLVILVGVWGAYESKRTKTSETEQNSFGEGDMISNSASEPYKGEETFTNAVVELSKSDSVQPSRLATSSGGLNTKDSFQSVMKELERFSSDKELQVSRLERILADEYGTYDRAQRTQMLSLLAKILTQHPNTTDVVLSGLETFQDQGIVVKDVIRLLNENEPSEAASWSTELDNPDLRRLAIQQTGKAWAEKDLTAVTSWAARLEKPDDVESAVQGVTRAMAQKDSMEVYQHVAQIEDDFLRNKMFLPTAKMMALKDPVATAKWAAQFPAEDSERESALSFSLFYWASRDLGGAMDFTSNIEDPQIRDASMLTISRSYAAQDPAAATEWIENIENVSVRNQAWVHSTSQWALKDSKGLARWMVDQNNQEMNGPILRQALQTIGQKNPQAAQEWIQLLTTPELKRAATETWSDLQGK